MIKVCPSVRTWQMVWEWIRRICRFAWRVTDNSSWQMALASLVEEVHCVGSGQPQLSPCQGLLKSTCLLVVGEWVTNLPKLWVLLLLWFSFRDDPKGFFLNFKDFTLFLEFIYSWDTQRERQRHRQREKQDPWREPDAGLNPRITGSWPEPKADAQPLSHPGDPKDFTLILKMA